ncbi:MAG: hypothetical protein LBJ42_02375 [Holosporales bacterium]|nr:hypothetical protein [Holosporales bacterium]
MGAVVITILQDVHTYLILSFIGMLAILWKLAYRKVASSLNCEIDSIRTKISSLETRRKEAELQIKNLGASLEEATGEMEKSIAIAEEEARKITEKSTAKVAAIIAAKQKEYHSSIEKIRAGVMAELHNKIVELVINKLSEKLRESGNDRANQDRAIDVSTRMIEELVNERRRGH